MIDTYFNRVSDTLDCIDRQAILKVCDILSDCKGVIFVFGNGGSAATASHFAQDMNKMLDDYRFICLNDNIPSLLAYGNDIGFDSIFELQLTKLLLPTDVVIGISCSGNSTNVINALKHAKDNHNITIGFTGFNGGLVGRLVDYDVHVSSNDMQICEDCHLIITHTIMNILK